MTKQAPVSLALVRNTARYYVARRRWRALARALWLTVVRRCGYELCQFCGGRYVPRFDATFAWHAPDPLWRELIDPNGGGLCCPACFDAKAEVAGYRLTWTPMIVQRDGVPTTNYWDDPTRDQLLIGQPDPGYVNSVTHRPFVPQGDWGKIAAALGLPRASYYWGTPGYVEENR